VTKENPDTKEEEVFIINYNDIGIEKIEEALKLLEQTVTGKADKDEKINMKELKCILKIGIDKMLTSFGKQLKDFKGNDTFEQTTFPTCDSLYSYV